MVESAAFEVFWKLYPRRVGKLAAVKAYTKARKIATAEQILAGVELYKRTKLPYADWCFPATFLNQGRWLDEPDEAVAVAEALLAKDAEDWSCQHRPPCCNSAMHQVTLARERGDIK